MPALKRFKGRASEYDRGDGKRDLEFIRLSFLWRIYTRSNREDGIYNARTNPTGMVPIRVSLRSSDPDEAEKYLIEIDRLLAARWRKQFKRDPPTPRDPYARKKKR
jgi:hypothetical protein